jgi:RNA-directed DNA polymerase
MKLEKIDKLKQSNKEHFRSIKRNKWKLSLSRLAKNSNKVLRKNQSFQNLRSILVDNLENAFWEVIKGGKSKQYTAGIDGLRPNEYRKNLSSNLKNLKQSLMDGSYKSSGLKLHKIEDSDRTVWIPVIEDRIVQYSAAAILNSIWEPRFKGFSFAYRPEKSTISAAKYLAKIIRESGERALVLKIDISKGFDSVPQDIVLGTIKFSISDPGFLGIVTEIFQGLKISSTDGRPCGFAQGTTIAPLLFNLAMDRIFDTWFIEDFAPLFQGRASALRYSDDIVIVIKDPGDYKASDLLADLKERLSLFSMELKTRKIHPLELDTNQRSINFLGYELSTWFNSSKRSVSIGIPSNKRSEIKKRLNKVIYSGQDLEKGYSNLNSQISQIFSYYRFSGCKETLQLILAEIGQNWLKHLESRGLDYKQYPLKATLPTRDKDRKRKLDILSTDNSHIEAWLNHSPHYGYLGNSGIDLNKVSF